VLYSTLKWWGRGDPQTDGSAIACAISAGASSPLVDCLGGKQVGERIWVTAMRKTKLPLLAAVHETVNGSHDVGMVDQVTLRDFDRRCLPPVEPLEPEQIKKIREASHVSQAVFARLLNTSVSTVQKWEIGQKKPTGTALKLLHLVQKRGLEAVA